jgi:hypothetical protein
MVFHLIFGNGVDREGGVLTNTLLLNDLNVDDYIEQYQEREQQAYREVKAAADRRALIAAQDAAYAVSLAVDQAKEKQAAEEAAAKAAEDAAARKENPTQAQFRDAWAQKARQMQQAAWSEMQA